MRTHEGAWAAMRGADVSGGTEHPLAWGNVFRMTTRWYAYFESALEGPALI